MTNLKGYFVSLETGEIWELSVKKKKELDRLYPNWVDILEDDTERDNIYKFFSKNGKLLAHCYLKNVLVQWSPNS